ncbi:hypothetical protein NIES4075_72310 [Tolypothrix sp. NIES-4075]|uniref:hypothetical protein n=1 Tax=Tolypothrix sp. NIES-4075 TaxID=2005459 RepID=UPI000B5CBFEE|nr:hypothetical protein [Tolypothrix sp. NIES-4075]GAX46210.1 hypothetical protein NIES4075_72310 [Tolypothrix sp. NIES-4075]
MHQPPEQLTLFTFEASQVDSVTIPKRWQKTYKSWRGEFEVIRDRKVGKSKTKHFDFSIEIYDPDGNCETVVEITAPLTSDAEAEFRYTVDKLEDGILSIPCPLVSESNLFIDSLTFTEVSNNTNDSLTFEDSPVSESLVSDVTSENDSLTAINIYKAKGTARGDRKYFRYSYKEGGKTKHLHIGGGNINCEAAQSRMQLVRDAIALGQSPNQIKQLIQQFRNLDTKSRTLKF